MAQLPTIYTIQASDAAQHTGRLQQILQNLKAERRIDRYTTLGMEYDLPSLTDNMEDDDLILVVLTNQLKSQQTQIEDKFKTFKVNRPGARIAEIIVDNVVYDNAFITFPVDLKPIRDREDMDAAWSSIERSLKEMFPLKTDPVPAAYPIDWLKYLKIAGIVIGLILAYFIIKGFMDRNDPPPPRDLDRYGLVEPAIPACDPEIETEEQISHIVLEV